MIENITQTGEVVTMLFDPAYIHSSTGQPGIDAGSGWTQTVQIVLRGVVAPVVLPELPCELSSGSLSANHVRWANVIPLPCVLTGTITLELRPIISPPLLLQATAIEIMPLSDPSYVEEFPGIRR